MTDYFKRAFGLDGAEQRFAMPPGFLNQLLVGPSFATAPGIMADAVLLMPDMAHVETAPDIFVPWETYVPLRWDLSDFGGTVRTLVADPALRARIAKQASDILHEWLKSDKFARAMAPLFS